MTRHGSHLDSSSPTLLGLAAGAILSTGCNAAGASATFAIPVGPPPALGGCDPDGGGCSGSPSSGPVGFGFGASQPSFGATVTAGTPPPPISGGTLLVTHDGHTAVAADPDRDAVYVVDTAAGSVTQTIALQTGDEPGRLTEDGAGRVHVALRRGGAVVAIEPSSGAIVSRRAVCPAPRGVAWDSSSDYVWVACATGELVALPAAGGAAARSFVIDRDLRDVVVQADGSLTVSQFRSATLLRIASDGGVSRRDVLPSAPSPGFAAQVAWRTIAGPSGSTVTTYQAESTSIVNTSSPGGYSGGGGVGVLPLALPTPGGSFDGDAAPPPEPAPPFLGPIVQSIVSTVGTDGSILQASSVQQVVLPVDVALSPDGSTIAIAAVGNEFSPESSVWTLPQQQLGSISSYATTAPAIAVAYDGNGALLVQTREPATLQFVTGLSPAIILSAITRADTGADIFHAQAGGLIACASCHPEGGDDGHVWMLDGLPRRTPSLRGTIAGTAPYHWPGDELTMGTLIDDVYTGRMGGAKLDPVQQGALTSWVESLPPPPAPSWVDASAVPRGQALFQGAGGCSTCHSGPKLTNNATVNVGTGTDEGVLPDGGPAPTAFQVPPLVGVGWRTPLMHNGCAATIADRFGSCATAGHGTTAQLSAQNVSDLTAYLESL